MYRVGFDWFLPANILVFGVLSILRPTNPAYMHKKRAKMKNSALFLKKVSA